MRPHPAAAASYTARPDCRSGRPNRCYRATAVRRENSRPRCRCSNRAPARSTDRSPRGPPPRPTARRRRGAARAPPHRPAPSPSRPRSSQAPRARRPAAPRGLPARAVWWRPPPSRRVPPIPQPRPRVSPCQACRATAARRSTVRRGRAPPARPPARGGRSRGS